MKKIVAAGLLISALIPTTAAAHGVAGNRFFPATLEIDDPSVADELTLPQVNTLKEKEADEKSSRETETSFEYSKRVTKNFGLSVEGAYVDQESAGHGFDNFGVSGKYQFYENDAHETIISAGVDWDIGGTGSDHIGAEHFSTVTPQVFFGKGFGDLPDGVRYLKPLAMTGQIGMGFPTDREFADEKNPTTFNYGFSLQYSLPYLQQHVKDIGLGAPFSQITPLVEMNFATPVAHNGGSNATTGTVNPGFIWSGHSSQIGLEAVIPVNNASGRGVGAMAQMHFYLDDIFPTTLGKPLVE